MGLLEQTKIYHLRKKNKKKKFLKAVSYFKMIKLMTSRICRYLRECLCKSQWRNFRRFSSGKSLLITSMAFANSVRRMDSRGFFSFVCDYQNFEVSETTFSLNLIEEIYPLTLIKFKIIIGFPYLIARFEKWSLVAS